MTDFSVQITNFQNYGTYSYLFDEAGNEILNPSSSIFQEHYIAFPTVNYEYDDSKIQSFYDVTLTEFVPAKPSDGSTTLPQNIIDQIDDITQRNNILENQLEELITKSETTSPESDLQLVKDIILTLRIQLGQGTSTNDFYSEFPYLPIPVENRDLTSL